jgi:hypothetical protein
MRDQQKSLNDSREIPAAAARSDARHAELRCPRPPPPPPEPNPVSPPAPSAPGRLCRKSTRPRATRPIRTRPPPRVICREPRPPLAPA